VILDGGQRHAFGLKQEQVREDGPRGADDAEHEEHDVHSEQVADGQVRFIDDERAQR